MGWFWKTAFRLSGWRVRDAYPNGIDKAILIVAPHTSAWDFPLGLAARSYLNLKHTYYLGKEELFKGPFGFLFRATGGYPVNRFNKEKMVDQVVELFNTHDQFILALSPEGTRKKVDRLRTGFYHIAKKAGIPIIMIGFDFSKKEISIASPFFAGEDEAADFRKIIEFFAPIKGKIPELGLEHLLNQDFITSHSENNLNAI
jgi:1-acyl-sn-glycerol-3-phosphate acyltransferase